MKIKIGDTETIEKTIDAETVAAFAKIAEDFNPVHLDEEYAATTQFGKPIVHGMLASSLISGLLASKLPGKGCIYLGQTIKFTKPIYVGESVTAKVTVTQIREDKPIVTLLTEVFNQQMELTISGEATVKLAQAV
ncbi:MaoC family dehydratase [Shewanella psychropiezotolerans]|uniref:MaoC family dehydratase n=1 Tax=Shewanella psychropiezotolerans TaxID=2593655 RepID=A0ABX5X5P1_9GAMM|nr:MULTISPECIES: MaoC family dehydratase [Shewanella]MPY25569.1 MaoC family dehydratase [Shewanella sp. YLB-07]QDO86057.1 MaoC family dehydratase [Shewanella psychropiezotolerans]